MYVPGVLVDTRRIILKSRATKYPILSLNLSLSLRPPRSFSSISPREYSRESANSSTRRTGNETRSYHTGQVSIQRWRTGLDIPPEQFPPKWNFDRVIIVLGGLETISIRFTQIWPANYSLGK